MGNSCIRSIRTIPHSPQPSSQAYKDTDSGDSAGSPGHIVTATSGGGVSILVRSEDTATRGSTSAETLVKPLNSKSATVPNTSSMPQDSGRLSVSHGSEGPLPSSRRLQSKVASMFGSSATRDDIPMILLPDTPTSRQSRQDSGRIPLSAFSSSRTASSRYSTHRVAKSVVSYQHIIDEVRAGLQPTPEKPADPRWRSLLPFQPRCLRHQVLNVNKDCTQVEGAIAFVDISGFSALANALANQGAKGAMLMSKYINDYLTRLIEVVYAFGGDIVAFAGDAFLALWEYSPTRDSQRAPLLRATQCTLNLQERFNHYEVPGTSIVLKIHAGLTYGGFMGFLIEGPGRSLYLLAGRPLAHVGVAV
eukprot:RCo014777